jgi:hypothetical protein
MSNPTMLFSSRSSGISTIMARIHDGMLAESQNLLIVAPHLDSFAQA